MAIHEEHFSTSDCKGKAGSFIAHHLDYNNFYFCMDDQTRSRVLSCPVKTRFHEQKQKCENQEDIDNESWNNEVFMCFFILFFYLFYFYEITFLIKI